MAHVKQCTQCGADFTRNRKFSRLQWKLAKYCSRECSGLSAAAAHREELPPLEVRFRERFATSPGCWEWNGTIDGYGYGVIDHAKHRYRAHVLAVQFDGRQIPDGHIVRHKCDNRRCVNPAHLETGTARDNAQDAVDRGRNSRGEKHGCAKLTEADVRNIRDAEGSYAAIARQFGIARPTAARIKKRLAWAHVT